MPLPTALHLRRAQARAELHAGRIDTARELLRAVVSAAPEDIEARLWLGDAELAAGNLTAAEQHYGTAQDLRPAAHDISARLRLVQVERGGSAQPWRNEATDRDLSDLRRDLGQLDDTLTFISEADVRRAAMLLDEIVNAREPAALIAERLSEIDRLLPALVELNVRAARREGQDDVAEALSQLLVSLRLQRGDTGRPATPARQGPLRALIVAPVGGSSFTGITAAALRAHGADVDESVTLAPERATEYDVIIAHEPHADAQMTQALAVAAAEGVAIVISLACDYARLPAEHPAFHRLGLGSAERIESFVTALGLADLVVTASETMAETLREAGHRARVIPTGWARAGGAWDLPREPRATLNLGWLAGPGTHLDLAQIRREVGRAVRAHPDVRLAIAGDPLAYQLFAQSVPDNQRLYLPPVSAADRPYLLAQFDLILQPLRSGAYAESLGTQPLIEAGARSLPWLATPTTAARAWGQGGLVAEDSEAWSTQLNRLLEQPQLRAELAATGRQAALAFEAGALADHWWRAATTALPLSRLKTLAGSPAQTPDPEPAVGAEPLVSRVWGGAVS